MTNERKNTIFTGYFLLIVACIFAANYALFGLNATATLYVDALGKSAGVSGILNVCFTIAACSSRLVCGSLCDTLGRRRVMLIGGAVLVVATGAYALLQNIVLLTVFRAVQGAAYAAMSVGAATALIDVLPQERLGEGLGYSALGGTLASASAPAVSLWVMDSGGGFAAVYLTMAAVPLAGLLAAGFCRYESKPGYRREASECEKKALTLSSLFERAALLPAMVQTVIQVGLAASYVFMSLFAVKRGYVNAGMYFTLSAVFSLLARIVGGRLADRSNASPVLALGLLLTAASFAGLSLSGGEWVYYLCGAAFGLGSGLVMPVMNRKAVYGVAPNRRGAASATFTISADIGAGVGGLVWGFFIDRAGFDRTFLLTAGWLVLSLLLTMALFARRGKGRDTA